MRLVKIKASDAGRQTGLGLHKNNRMKLEKGGTFKIERTIQENEPNNVQKSI